VAPGGYSIFTARAWKACLEKPGLQLGRASFHERGIRGLGFQGHRVSHAFDLVAGHLLGTLSNHFLQRPPRHQGIVHFASQGCGIALQRGQRDIAPGLSAFGVDDGGLRDAH
jgi:hypothetical protein